MLASLSSSGGSALPIRSAATYPPEARAEIYSHYIDEIKRISPQTPVNLCTEERQIWDMLSHKLDMSPDHLFCCCGQFSAPGSRASSKGRGRAR